MACLLTMVYGQDWELDRVFNFTRQGMDVRVKVFRRPQLKSRQVRDAEYEVDYDYPAVIDDYDDYQYQYQQADYEDPIAILDEVIGLFGFGPGGQGPQRQRPRPRPRPTTNFRGKRLRGRGGIARAGKGLGKVVKGAGKGIGKAGKLAGRVAGKALFKLFGK